MSGRTPEQILAEFGAELRTAKPRRGRPVAVALVVAAGLAVAGALSLVREAPEREMVATPAPVVATPTAPPPSMPAVQIDATLRDPADILADVVLAEQLNPDAAVLRAWSVPELEGDVLLTVQGRQWCLSVPDPATDQPQIERGSTCGPAGANISLSIGPYYVAVVAGESRTPEIRYPGGAVEKVEPADGGLLVLSGLPAGGSVSTFGADGKGRLEGIPLRCDDGRAIFPEDGKPVDPGLCDPYP